MTGVDCMLYLCAHVRVYTHTRYIYIYIYTTRVYVTCHESIHAECHESIATRERERGRERERERELHTCTWPAHTDACSALRCAQRNLSDDWRHVRTRFNLRRG